MSKFLPFEEALAVALSLGLASAKEWHAWSKEGLRPPNVPATPNRVYKYSGWQGWGHWLGTGNARRNTTPFLPFDGALAVARSLGLANIFEWQQWCKKGMRPLNVPTNPHKTYKNGGWQGWGHWLGTGNTKHHRATAAAFLPFTEALAVAQSLNLANQKEWRVWCKEGMRPPNVPTCPDRTYKNGGWQGWGHWLGTGNQHTNQYTKEKEFLPFPEAVAVAQSLWLASAFECKQWRKEGMRPANVPACPRKVYNSRGWHGWGHWLGTGNQATQAKQSLPFNEARTVARSLDVANNKECTVWCREGMRPPNVPSNPQATYKDGGWQAGNVAPSEAFLPFDEALRVARQLRLVSSSEWHLWCRSGARPANVPARPDLTYVHDGWTGWVHWLLHENLDAAPASTTSKCEVTDGAGTARKRQRR